MNEIQGEVPQKIYVGLEDQKHASRGKLSVEAGWNQQSANFPENLQQLNVDRLIVGLAENAENAGREEIVILDVGSGPEGKFVTSFFDNKEYPELHDFLVKHPKLKVRVVGVTGAKHTQGELIKRQESGDYSRVTAENYGYTITSSRTVGTFLREHEIFQVDAAFATFSTGYFMPSNFAGCLEDVANVLSEDGVFYGIKWHWVPAGFKREVDGSITPAQRLSLDNPLFDFFHYRRKSEKADDPKENLVRFLESIDYAILKHFISKEETYILFNEYMILPSTYPFTKSFLRYAKPEEIFDVENNSRGLIRKARREGKVSFITPQNWKNVKNIITNLEDLEQRLYAPIRESSEEFGARMKKFQQAEQQVATFYQENYRDNDPLLPDLDLIKSEHEIILKDENSYVGYKYAIRKWDAMAIGLKTMKSECHDWDEVESVVLKMDIFEVMNYLHWSYFLGHVGDLIVKNLMKKTFEQKRAKLVDLQGRRQEDLEVVFNELDFFIRKKRKS